MIAAAAIASTAAAGEPDGLVERSLAGMSTSFSLTRPQSEPQLPMPGYVPGSGERGITAAASLRVPNGWTASLLVNYLGRAPASEDGGASLRASSLVNARLARNLSKDTRISLDVFNVFDQRVGGVDYLSSARSWNPPGAADSFLFNPAEPRGFRIKLRTTFR